MKIIRTLAYSLGIVLSYVAIAESSISENENWNFRVFLNDTPIGTHSFKVQQNKDISRVDIRARFDVKFLFLSVYQYSHSNSETWKSGCLQSLSSKTDDNGDKQFVELKNINNTYHINTHSGTEKQSDCLRSFSYWAPEQLDTPALINAQTGEITPVTFKLIGDTRYQDTVPALHYKLTGEKIDIDLWYDHNHNWIALHSQLDNGDLLRYERLETN